MNRIKSLDDIKEIKEEFKTLKNIGNNDKKATEHIRNICSAFKKDESTNLLSLFQKQDIGSKFQSIIHEQLNTNPLNYELLNYIYGTLNNILYTAHTLPSNERNDYMKITEKVLKNDFYTLAITLLEKLDDISKTINIFHSLMLYKALIHFILNYRVYLSFINEHVVILTNQYKKLKDLTDLHLKSRTKYLMLSILKELVDLILQHKIDKTVFDDSVDQIISGLNECIDRSKTNEKFVQNTKFYIEDSICSFKSYHTAETFLGVVQKEVSYDPQTKKTFFEKGIMTILDEISTSGNKNEVSSCEMVSISFSNELYVQEYNKNRIELEQTIKKLKESLYKNNQPTLEVVKAKCVKIEEVWFSSIKNRISI